MTAKDCLDSTGILRLLPWDSRYFGFPVARITGADLGDAGVSEALRAARARSVRLVYWAKTPGLSVSPEILQEFAGSLVDQKATFATDLAAQGRSTADAESSPFVVVEHPKGAASPQLLELGVRAGQFSRFQTDPRITAEQFRGLYEIWMDRSTRGELAGAVFTALPREGPAEPVGVITAAESGRVGQIGLLAVSEGVRGQGIGTRLVKQAHEWMRKVGAGRAEVVTQLANRAACRLYEGCGYRLHDVQDYYHFWPLAACGN
jgi:dTDP-4-amino-4,6-dideoxy-D-galactose acyltransferase